MTAYAPKQGKPVVQGVMTYPEQIARCGAAEGLTAHPTKWENPVLTFGEIRGIL